MHQSSNVSAALTHAAFGQMPGMAVLPPARTARDAWQRAVALGGQGYYSRARAELERVRELDGADSVLLSLVCSTRASFLRQLGWHRLAAPIDGRALAHLAGGSTGDVVDSRVAAARCDALTGLAADALGQGRFALGSRLLDRCRPEVASIAPSDSGGPARQAVRLEWVSAEIALATGRSVEALGHARQAVEYADAGSSIRHRIKSRLLVAASLCADGDLAAAGEMAATVLEQCSEQGLVPLRWAAAMLSDALGDAAGSGAVAGECRVEIGRRGGVFRPM